MSDLHKTNKKATKLYFFLISLGTQKRTSACSFSHFRLNGLDITSSSHFGFHFGVHRHSGNDTLVRLMFDSTPDCQVLCLSDRESN